MRVEINIGLDSEGVHSFSYKPAQVHGVEVPHTILQRWAAEREAFALARLRWQRVIEEIDEHLHKQAALDSQPEVVTAAVRSRR